MNDDLDALKRKNQAALAARADYHPTLRDGSQLGMVRCPGTGKAARGESWMSITNPGSTACSQCASEAEWEAIAKARQDWEKGEQR